MATKTDKDYQKEHRKRLRERFLAGKLTDQEHMELLLSYAIPRIDVKPLAYTLLKKYGGVQNVLVAPIEDLLKVSGVGPYSAGLLKLVNAVNIMNLKNTLTSTPMFRDPKVLENYCKFSLAAKTVEEFHVLYLNSEFKLILDNLHSIGTIDWAAVHPREVVRRALDVNSRIMILVHNHPGGGDAFSTDDIKITHAIQDAAISFDSVILDHLLVVGNNVHSLKELRLLKEYKDD